MAFRVLHLLIHGVCFTFTVLVLSACGAFAQSGMPDGQPTQGMPGHRTIQGVWLTTTANNAIASAEDSAASMQRLREIGINTVYVETWKNGYTQFPSKVLLDTIGLDRRPALMPADPGDPDEKHRLPGRDLLGETLIQAHRNQLTYIAWFEYGFMAAHKDTHNHLRKQHPHWMTTTREGQTVSDQNPFVWMNPMRPECQDFLLAIILEAVDKYDLDGIQLDDRIAWPVTMGYDDFTKQAYAAEHDGAMPPDDPRDPDWIAWRAGKVTEFAQRLYRELKQARPNLIVSISPAVYPWSLNNYACDWPAWSSNGLMTEFVPQNYRYDYDAFATTWADQVDAMPGMLDRLVAGVLVNSGDRHNPWGDIQREIMLVNDSGSAGHVFWFSPGVLDIYPDELAAYYKKAGPASNPHLPADWRPAPIVCEQISDSVFTSDVKSPGHYRVIVLQDGVWSVAETLKLDAGPFTFERPGAQQVELLVDRRHHPDLNIR